MEYYAVTGRTIGSNTAVADWTYYPTYPTTIPYYPTYPMYPTVVTHPETVICQHLHLCSCHDHAGLSDADIQRIIEALKPLISEAAKEEVANALRKIVEAANS